MQKLEMSFENLSTRRQRIGNYIEKELKSGFEMVKNKNCLRRMYARMNVVTQQFLKSRELVKIGRKSLRTQLFD